MAVIYKWEINKQPKQNVFSTNRLVRLAPTLFPGTLPKIFDSIRCEASINKTAIYHRQHQDINVDSRRAKKKKHCYTFEQNKSSMKLLRNVM